MAKIKSEHQFVWMFILNILLSPITLIHVLLRKKDFKQLFKPFEDLLSFVFEPKFTISIIIANIIIFIVSFSFSEQLIVSLINYPADLLNFRFYTIVTAAFLHASLTHLLGNMLGIFIFGRVVERKLGFSKTMVVYFGALVISGLFQSLIHLFIIGDNTGGIGASGALMGLVSTAILLDPFYLTYELILPLPIMIIGWLTIYADIAGIINPTQDGIGHFAHIGGFISIALIMYFLGIKGRSKLKRGFLVNLVSLAVALNIYLFIV
ncbi:rhomboid family intramembrane serine protease [Candidatus Woesearchaeota archaeon]|nr:rhomboid family intramembrane serine protease [Candidatus Woesearchaeota archaeon]